MKRISNSLEFGVGTARPHVPECFLKRLSNRCAGLHRGHHLSNCCEPLLPPHDGRGASRSEQNPQVPLASEDAFAQVPGNAETAVGNPSVVQIVNRKFLNPMGRHRKHPLKITDAGARRLICAIVEQAVVDFKGLVAMGCIVNGVALPCARTRRYDSDYRTEAEVKDLLDFFTKGALDEWLFVAGIRINPNLIREKLGISPQPSIVEGRPSVVASQGPDHAVTED
ncbi:MAG TPA: hypothetical protein VMF08_13455 [Candidatus Sulfotelmatobacter sp.]|nr:hypothetical protein [Candidatus Sulfotelmatobacter sp.]